MPRIVPTFGCPRASEARLVQSAVRMEVGRRPGPGYAHGRARVPWKRRDHDLDDMHIAAFHEELMATARDFTGTLGAVRLALACALAWLTAPTVATAAPPAAAAGEREIARRTFGAGQLRLVVDARGMGTLLYADTEGEERAVPCDRLEGAWGLWVGDVEGDGSPEAIVTLRKRAKFDPVTENRLHVYAIEDGQCVPVWRGTRLAGRFERLAVAGERLLVLERVGAGRRVASYCWYGFGYRLEKTLWQGRGTPRPRLMALFAERKKR